MARIGRFGRASLARCSQNRRCRIACRRGAYRPPTKAGLGAGCRACVDRTYRPNIECCRLHGRRRAILPGRRVGTCLSIEIVVPKPLRMIPRPGEVMQIIDPLGDRNGGLLLNSLGVEKAVAKLVWAPEGVEQASSHGEKDHGLRGGRRGMP
jgi:hypothetical protein